MALARMPKSEIPTTTVHGKVSVTYSYMSPKRKRKPIDFSLREVEHLALATALVVSVGLSLYYGNTLSSTIPLLAISAVAFTASFLLHEIAHKIVAQRHGLWAEFRLTSVGAILTALSIILPVKFISPGAVMVAGASDPKTIGKTAVAGPTVNIFLATILFAASIVWQNVGLGLIAVAWFNGWIATFNLIPFGIFDGLKVFNWNKSIWLLSFAASVALTVGLGIAFFGGLA
jgi:Zn-dependent protease